MLDRWRGVSTNVDEGFGGVYFCRQSGVHFDYRQIILQRNENVPGRLNFGTGFACES
jgi:hypothetical protein